MESTPPRPVSAGTAQASQHAAPTVTSRRRSGSGGGILSRFPFMRTSESRPNLRADPRPADIAEEDLRSPRPAGSIVSNGSHDNSGTTPTTTTTTTSTTAATHHHYQHPAPQQLQQLQQRKQEELQQPKTRRRKGSLRKVALLGRGAQREKRELKPLAVDTSVAQAQQPAQPAYGPDSAGTTTNNGNSVSGGGLVASPVSMRPTPTVVKSPPPAGSGLNGVGLGISDITPRPSMDGYAHRAATGAGTGAGAAPAPAVAAAAAAANTKSSSMPLQPQRAPPPIPGPGSLRVGAAAATTTTNNKNTATSPTISYTSTTDEEDVLSLRQARTHSPLRPGHASVSSGSESYYNPARTPSLSIQRRRSVKHAKSPLSLQGLTASPLPVPDPEYDYSETEWWGWVILVVTWVVFVIGMGSCLGVWSWAWDVGTTPYAPPEFEDDPTLPIVGYYPALMILTCIMAWVWVVTAWVGMKYFRHAKITGD